MEDLSWIEGKAKIMKSGKTYYLNWDQYREICQKYGINPWANESFGVDLGGGESDTYKCVDDPPEREEE